MQQNEPHPADSGCKLDYATPLPPVAGRPGLALVTISFVCAMLPLAAVMALLDRHKARGDDGLVLLGLLVLAIIAMAAGWACGAVAFWTAKRNGDTRLRRRAVAAVVLNVLWVVGSIGAVAEDYVFHAYKRHREIAEAQATGIAKAKELWSIAQRNGDYPRTFIVPGFAYAGDGLRRGPALDNAASRIVLLYGDELSEHRQVLVFVDRHAALFTAPTVAQTRMVSDAERIKVILATRVPPYPRVRWTTGPARSNAAP